MASPVLAFRPASVVARLPPRCEACPLSPRDLFGAMAAGAPVPPIPLVRAPLAGVARGALVAAREAGSVLGLALPPGVPPQSWFDAVTEAADGLAAGLPLVLAGEIRVGGEGAAAVERAVGEAWKLVDAGLTHLCVDVGPVAPAARARAVAEVARPASERGLGVECLLIGSKVADVAALFERLAAWGIAPDAAGVRLPAPADEESARAQAADLAAISAALGGIAVVRRGPTTPAALAALAGGPVRMVEDGAAAAAALSVLPWEVLEDAGPERPGIGPLERAAASLGEAEADRLEARAYVEVLELVEALGAVGSAAAIAQALERRRVEEDR